MEVQIKVTSEEGIMERWHLCGTDGEEKMEDLVRMVRMHLGEI